MTHKVVNFDIHAGDTLQFEVLVTENGQSDGQVIDLTGCDIIWALSTTAHEPERAITKTLGAGITCDAPGTGIFTVKLTPEDTQDLVGIYQHQGRITDPEGNKTTVVKGRVEVDRTILTLQE